MFEYLIIASLLVNFANSIVIQKPAHATSHEEQLQIKARISHTAEALLRDGGVINVFVDDGGSNTIYNFDVPPTPNANAKKFTFKLEDIERECIMTADSLASSASLLKITVPRLEEGIYSIWIELEHPGSSQLPSSETRSDVIAIRIAKTSEPVSMRNIKKGISLKDQQLAEQEAEKRERRDQLTALYKPLMKHPELLELQESQVFDPKFLDFLHSNPQTKDDLLKFMYQETDSGIYSFPLLSDDFVTKLLEEIDNIHTSGVETVAPNTMNNYGIILDEFGFHDFLTTLINKYLTPLTSILYPEWGGNSLDGHHGFIVEYQLGEDLELANHMDSCEITLNVCLGKSFKGGELLFQGIRNTPSENVESFRIGHTPGKALLHVGQHWHQSLPITEGARYNLILWMMSSTFRQSPSEKYYHQHATPASSLFC